MPRLPMNYQNTIIYKIVCRDLSITNCYVGHTTNFIERKSHHKCNCKKAPEYVYHFIREHGGWDNWTMIMIEQYQCTNLYEASARERYWIETLNADLNQKSPPTGLARSEYKKQYYNENTEKVKEHSKEYYIENADKISECRKQYYVENRDKLSERNKQRVCCIQCKTELSFGCLARHCKSKH